MFHCVPFYTGFACKDDEPVIYRGVQAQVTFLLPEGPALTSYAVMPVCLLGRFNSWTVPGGPSPGSLPREAELESQAARADLPK